MFNRSILMLSLPFIGVWRCLGNIPRKSIWILVALCPALADAQVWNPVNDRYYQAFASGGITWSNAKVAAESSYYLGSRGSLVCITSAQENSFITSNLPDIENYWLGGYQPGGSAEPDGNWQWVSGEPFNSFANWYPGEPNDGGGSGSEGMLGFKTDGMWNDLPSWYPGPGYVVEYKAPYPYNASNGHFYGVVIVPGGISWAAASNAAATNIFRGMAGHLATLTSAQETAFLTASFTNLLNCWVGGTQPSGSAEPAGDWRWITGEDFNSYANWNAGEPNDAGGQNSMSLNATAKWNDVNGTNLAPGYVIEFDMPIISDITTAIEFSFLSVPGRSYQVQVSTDPNLAVWTDIGAPIVGNGSNFWQFISTRQTPYKAIRVK